MHPKATWLGLFIFAVHTGAVSSAENQIPGSAGVRRAATLLNPARVFGPALASWFWHDHYVYWIGPLIGGALGGFVYGLVIERKPVSA